MIKHALFRWSVVLFIAAVVRGLFLMRSSAACPTLPSHYPQSCVLHQCTCTTGCPRTHQRCWETAFVDLAIMHRFHLVQQYNSCSFIKSCERESPCHTTHFKALAYTALTICLTCQRSWKSVRTEMDAIFKQGSWQTLRAAVPYKVFALFVFGKLT